MSFYGKFKGNGNFHFPFWKLWEMSPFPRNFPHKNVVKFHHFLQCMYIFFQGTPAYDKLMSILVNTKIVNDIKKLSPQVQTSSLEGFHSLFNHWHPKMLCFSFIGTKCRFVA